MNKKHYSNRDIERAKNMAFGLGINSDLITDQDATAFLNLYYADAFTHNLELRSKQIILWWMWRLDQ